MGVTAISKIHSKTLNTDREAPLQAGDLEDPAKVFPLTYHAGPLNWYPEAHLQDIKARPKDTGQSWPLSLQASRLIHFLVGVKQSKLLVLLQVPF